MLASTIGAKRARSSSLVFCLKYCVAASSAPDRIARASAKLMALTASTKIPVASPAARSAARFMATSSSSTWAPKPTARKPFAVASSWSGIAIRIRALPRNPSSVDVEATVRSVPTRSASFRPATIVDSSRATDWSTPAARSSSSRSTPPVSAQPQSAAESATGRDSQRLRQSPFDWIMRSPRLVRSCTLTFVWNHRSQSRAFRVRTRARTGFDSGANDREERTIMRSERS